MPGPTRCLLLALDVHDDLALEQKRASGACPWNELDELLGAALDRRRP
jgi:hypothetical protein